MGNQTGKDKTNNDIEKKMAESAATNANQHSLLLLGAGESGKSTLLRQMRHLWGKQFQSEERQNYQKILWGNIIECMQILCQQCAVLAPTHKECEIDEKLEPQLQFVMSLDAQNPPVFDQKLCESFTNLWNEKGIQNTLLHRGEFYILDSVEYLMNTLPKYVGAEYCPTFEDMLRCRVRSTGLKKENFVFQDAVFSVFDVGGQKAERRKWLTVCDDVTALIYVCSLAGYNQVTFEDNTSNALVQSMAVYDQYINHDAFSTLNVILFLNKSDIFNEMIPKVPFTVCPMKEYKGGKHDKDNIITFVVEEFKKRTMGCQEGKRTVFPHTTNATSTENIRVVFTAIRHIVFKNYLKGSAMLK